MIPGRLARKFALCVWLGFAGVYGVAPARAVAPDFTGMTPTGGTRGTTVEVILRGERLADIQEILLYTAGIAVEHLGEATEKQVKVRLRIAPDCQLGEHLLRLRTAGGISPLRIFFVGPFPAVDEREPNNSLPTAQAVALNSTVQGTLSAEDEDWFSVVAGAGQRISAEVEGARLGRTMFDPILTLHDASGSVIARADDSPLLGHDGYLSVLAPAAGTYWVRLRDVAYSGAGHLYRLHLGDFARPAVLVPGGGQAGETIAARFLGDPAGEIDTRLALPEQPVGRFGVQAQAGSPSPNWLRVVAFPNAPSTSPGKTLADAARIAATVPFAINGVLERSGEAAFYRFKARKDQHLELQVHARRLGSPLDSVLTVFGPKGNTLGSNDDAAGHPDSTLRVRVPEDGDYTVKIADQLNRGGPLYAYRIEITPVEPKVVLSIPDTARYDNETRKSIVVPRGNRFAVLMNVTRDLYNGDVRLAFDGLPEGVTASSEIVPGAVSAAAVLFEAAPDAPIAGSLLSPTAVAVGPDQPGGLASSYRHAVDWVRIQNDTVYVRSEVDRIAAAVVEEVPFKIRLVPPQVPLVQGGEMAMQVVAERAEGFVEPITVKLLWNPPGVSSQPEIVIAKGADTAAYKLNATSKAETRSWKLAAIAGATVRGGVAYVSSPATDLEVAEPFVAGKIEIAKVERGQTTRVVCALEQKRPFEGEAEAQLVGLPDGVTANPVAITQHSREAVFEVVTTAKSPTGTHKNVSCRVTVRQHGEPIVHGLAPGSVLRIDPARGNAVAAATRPAAGSAK